MYEKYFPEFLYHINALAGSEYYIYKKGQRFYLSDICTGYEIYYGSEAQIWNYLHVIIEFLENERREKNYV